MQYRFFEGIKQYERIPRGAQVDRDRQTCEGLTRKLHNFSFEKKKKTLVNRKIQESSDTERFLQEDATGELESLQRWANFTVFSIAKCTNKAAARSGRPVSNPDPNNTIGLLQ